MHTDPRRIDRINREAGAALQACGNRKRIASALGRAGLGRSKTRVQQQVTGDPTGWLQRAAQAVRELAADAKANPFPPIRYLYEVAMQGRHTKQRPEEMAAAVFVKSPQETRAESGENEAMERLTRALGPLAFAGPDKLTLAQRLELVEALRAAQQRSREELDRQFERDAAIGALLEWAEEAVTR